MSAIESDLQQCTPSEWTVESDTYKDDIKWQAYEYVRPTPYDTTLDQECRVAGDTESSRDIFYTQSKLPELPFIHPQGEVTKATVLYPVEPPPPPPPSQSATHVTESSPQVVTQMEWLYHKPGHFTDANFYSTSSQPGRDEDEDENTLEYKSNETQYYKYCSTASSVCNAPPPDRSAPPLHHCATQSSDSSLSCPYCGAGPYSARSLARHINNKHCGDRGEDVWEWSEEGEGEDGSWE